MVAPRATRRQALCGLAVLGFAGLPARAEAIVDLDWGDLVMPGEAALPPQLRGLVQHDAASLAQSQPPSRGVRRDWNGQTVRLSGFLVPLDYEGSGVTAFILVPYVGACVHVPPPPANQLVLVTTERPHASRGLFEAVTVTGMFGTASAATRLAAIGYTLSADRITAHAG